MFIHSRAVLDNLVNNVKKISRFINIAVQLIFLIFYAFEIYSSYGNNMRFFAYIVLLSLSTISFIVGFWGKSTKKARKVIRICKYPINLSLITLSIIVIVRGEADVLKTILTGLTAISFLLNVSMEFIRLFVENYAKMFKTSISMDCQVLAEKLHFKDGKFTLFDIPQMLANKIQPSEPSQPTAEQQRILALSKPFEQNIREKNKIKVAQQKEKRKERRQQNLQIIRQKLFGKKRAKNNHQALPPAQEDSPTDK